MSDDPHRLLRHPGPIDAYPLEPSNDELAQSLGLPLGRIVRYDLNTMGGGPLPGVRGAWEAWDPAAAVEYGDLAYRRLREAIGGVIGVEPHRIIPGAGADELIRLVTTSVVGPGDGVVIATPTFPMFAVEAGLAGARVHPVPREHPRTRQTPDAIRSRVEATGSRLAWICSPNNPTGDAHPLAELHEIAEGLEAVVTVDQVYLEFADASGATGIDAIGLQDELDNLLVLRSMAKAYGLAGARIGYLVVPDALAERFDALRLPLSVGAATEALAVGALADPSAPGRRRAIVAERERLADALRKMSCEVLDGLGNFVTFRPPDAARLAAALLARGLVVREFPATGPMGGWLRATARAADENELLITALAEELG